LRGLEDARSGFVEGLVAATLFVGGQTVRERIYDALEQPRRGLLAPALRYLSGYSTPADVPLLLRLFDRHNPLRSIILNLVECVGAKAQPHLQKRIDAGGSDEPLAALERRQAMLEACTNPKDIGGGT